MKYAELQQEQSWSGNILGSYFGCQVLHAGGMRIKLVMPGTGVMTHNWKLSLLYTAGPFPGLDVEFQLFYSDSRTEEMCLSGWMLRLIDRLIDWISQGGTHWAGKQVKPKDYLLFQQVTIRFLSRLYSHLCNRRWNRFANWCLYAAAAQRSFISLISLTQARNIIISIFQSRLCWVRRGVGEQRCESRVDLLFLTWRPQ